ncbi:MAG: ABC transporter permease [Verrucomicrobia bacterium]|nr:ABC transporter permease [Verrucomicrobiota bacterium]MBI3871220.1 ABC transporter permease [Verrucomicrobiota bacterium]
MQAYWTLVKREIGGHFLSWSGYVVVAATVFLIGLNLVILIESFGNEATHRPITELFCGSYPFWIILLLAPPVVTMRAFAMEKSSGTFETLMTTPVSDVSVVLAKFTGAMLVYACLWLPLIPCLWMVQRLSQDPVILDQSSVGGALLGILLLGMVFMSIGCLASALTRSQTVAAIMSFCAGTSLLLLSFLAWAYSGEAASLKGRFFAQINLVEQLQDFASGVIDTRPLVLYTSLTAFFLFFTKRVVESRRWK